MLHGALVALRSGIVIASYGIENVQLISSLISATIGIGEEVKGTGKLKKLSYEDKDIHIAISRRNPNLVAVVISDSGDSSAPFVAKRLVAAVENFVPPDVEVVTDDLIKAVQGVLEALFGSEKKLPSIQSLSRIASAVFSYILDERRQEFDEEIAEFSEEERRKAAKKAMKLKKVKGVRDISKGIRECAKRFYSWNLYKAFEMARQIHASKGGEEYGALLAAKIGALLLQLPPDYESPDFKTVESFLERRFTISSILLEFVKLQVYSITRGWRDEFRRFVSTRADELVSVLKRAGEDVADLYAMLFFVQSRTIFRTELGDEIVNFLLGRSDALYRLMLSERNTTRLYDLLFSPKRWEEIRAEISQFKLNYMKARTEIEGRGPLQDILTIDREMGMLIEEIAALREYLLSVLVAFESYGLSAKQREEMLNEVYQETLEEVLKLLSSRPPVLSRVYYDLYQFILYIMYYLTYFKTRQRTVWLWRDIIDTAKDGLRLFMSYLVRGRMTKFQFVNYASPMAYMIGKASLRLNEFPTELAFYIKTLGEIDEETARHLDGQVASERIFILTHSLVAIAAMSRLIPIQLRAAAVRAVMYFLDVIGEWGILNAKMSREFIDDYADVLSLLIASDIDADWVLGYLEKALMYADILVGVEEENPFETAAVYERILKLAVAYIERFGPRREVIEIARYASEKAIKMWRAEGYTSKAKEMEALAREVEELGQENQLSPSSGRFAGPSSS